MSYAWIHIDAVALVWFFGHRDRRLRGFIILPLLYHYTNRVLDVNSLLVRPWWLSRFSRRLDLAPFRFSFFSFSRCIEFLFGLGLSPEPFRKMPSGPIRHLLCSEIGPRTRVRPIALHLPNWKGQTSGRCIWFYAVTASSFSSFLSFSYASPCSDPACRIPNLFSLLPGPHIDRLGRQGQISMYDDGEGGNNIEIPGILVLYGPVVSTYLFQLFCPHTHTNPVLVRPRQHKKIGKNTTKQVLVDHCSDDFLFGFMPSIIWGKNNST